MRDRPDCGGLGGAKAGYLPGPGGILGEAIHIAAIDKPVFVYFDCQKKKKKSRYSRGHFLARPQLIGLGNSLDDLSIPDRIVIFPKPYLSARYGVASLHMIEGGMECGK